MSTICGRLRRRDIEHSFVSPADGQLKRWEYIPPLGFYWKTAYTSTQTARLLNIAIGIYLLPMARYGRGYPLPIFYSKPPFASRIRNKFQLAWFAVVVLSQMMSI